RGSLVDLAKIIRGKLDRYSPDVLVQPFQPPCARDRNDPGLLCEQPSERDLGRRRLLPSRYLAQQFDQDLIGPASLGREAGEVVAEVGTVKRRVFGDLPGEEPPAERAVGNEA